MHAVTMIVWLGTTPAQMQAVQSAQATPAARYDMIRVKEQRATMTERTSEPRAKIRAEPPTSMR